MRLLPCDAGVDLDMDYRKQRTLEKQFLQGREAMKHGDFTGILDIRAQDKETDWRTLGRAPQRMTPAS